MNCTLFCASYFLGVSPEILQTEMGHDGGDIIWPEYIDERMYRGYSIAEIQNLFFMRNKMLAPIFLYPASAPDYDAKPRLLYTVEEASKRYWNMTKGRECIFFGDTEARIGHAVCWDKDKYIDPRCLTPSETLINFNPREAYIITRLI